MTGFFAPPDDARYALRNLRAPACLVAGELLSAADPYGILALDLVVDDGRIAAIAPPGSIPAELGPDLDRAMVLPGLIDAHAHLDKCHIWPRMTNPDGSHGGAAAAVAEDRRLNWTAEDVRARMSFALQCAYARGVVAIRTHIDSLAPQGGISFPVFRRMRDEWAGRIEMQCSSIVPWEVFQRPDEAAELADLVAASSGNLGLSVRLSGRDPRAPQPDFEAAMERFFTLAIDRGLNIDLHVDECGEQGSSALIRVARMARARGFKGTLLCGHCCALSIQEDDFVTETLNACAEAGVDIVSLPLVNMYLQNRAAGVTPRWRGVTIVHEMRARGLRVAIAGDNARDPFYAYGDHDMLETFTQSVRIAHLDMPVGDWMRTVTDIPAAIMQLPDAGMIRTGTPANLLVLKARSYSELLARFQADRVVIRHGKAIDTTPPDFRALDPIVGAP